VTDGPQPGRRHDYLGFYHALGLEPVGASQEDVKKAFRQAALRWHPDKQRDDHARREARERFHAIRAAYDVLRSPAKRKLYDAGELRL
jgi:curved DNA-binding protein CbpA